MNPRVRRINRGAARHPDAPRHWTGESDPELFSAAQAYRGGEPLSQRQIAVLQAYLWRWLQSPVWIESPAAAALRCGVAVSQTRSDLTECLGTLRALGMGDPL